MNFFEINPDFDLNIMKNNQSLINITSAVLEKTYEVINQVKPNLVMVHGDTTTTFSAALASFYHKVPVAHIEAGLRTTIYIPCLRKQTGF